MTKKQSALKIILPIAIVLTFFSIITIVVLGRAFYGLLGLNSNDEELADFSIAAVSDEEVATRVFASNYKSSLRNSGKSTGVTESYYERYDFTICDHSIGKATGIDVVSATKIDNATLKLTITSKVESGEAKIAIIKDGTLVEYIDINETVVWEYDVSEKSLFLVKIVCKDAKIDIKIEREIKPK
jgi:hypothetical protein